MVFYSRSEPDAAVLIIDVVRGQILGTWNAHRGYVRGVAFSPDGTAVAAGTIDRGVVMWSLDPASWDRMACVPVALRASRTG